MNEEMKMSLSVLVIITSVKTIIKEYSEYTQSQPPEKKSSHRSHIQADFNDLIASDIDCL